ncbi:MAG: potassium transporter TrkG, partial [Thermodesulfobacteriota bacterium]
REIFDLIKMIFLFTGIFELCGTFFLFIHWVHEYPVFRALYLALFHSVSAFCNAGFSLFSESLMKYPGAWLPNMTICMLIFLGGIGFPVLYELFVAGFKTPWRRVRFSVQTKTVLMTSMGLVLSGALFFLILEWDSILKDKALNERLLISLFQSITCRTAGFNTVDIGALHTATLTVMLALMFFGASPGSCGGGVKTTTLAVIFAFARSRFRTMLRTHLFKKSIPDEVISKSTSLILISLGWIALIVFLILLSRPSTLYPNPHGDFLPYLFETVSAFGTVGLSMGATATLTGMGKFWIILMMLIGRVGVLTFSYLITGPSKDRRIEYAEEQMMIG